MYTMNRDAPPDIAKHAMTPLPWPPITQGQTDGFIAVSRQNQAKSCLSLQRPPFTEPFQTPSVAAATKSYIKQGHRSPFSD